LNYNIIIGAGYWRKGKKIYDSQNKTHSTIDLGVYRMDSFLDCRVAGILSAIFRDLYISVPLFIYDIFYCGFYLGHGASFFTKYWYLTVYYILPWILFPPTGWLVERIRNIKMASLNAYQGS
jgi:hypothetical protein